MAQKLANDLHKSPLACKVPFKNLIFPNNLHTIFKSWPIFVMKCFKNLKILIVCRIPLLSAYQSCNNSVLLLFLLNFPGQVFDGKAPDRPYAVILTQPVLESHDQILLVGRQPHRGRGAHSGAGPAVEALGHCFEVCCCSAVTVPGLVGRSTRTEPLRKGRCLQEDPQLMNHMACSVKE